MPEDTNNRNSTIWDFFVDHRRFTYVVMLALFILGVSATMQLPRESNPEVDIPVGVVSTFFPGASSEDVEELVSNLIEDKALGLDDVKEVTSISAESVSTVVVEFEADADSEERIDDLKDAIDEIKSKLPDDAEDPDIFKVRFSDEAIYTFAMSGPYDSDTLRAYATDLSDELERISGVSKISIAGGREDEIHVLVDKPALDRVGISISDVSRAISLANTDIPTGSIETGGYQYSLRLAGQIDTIEDVKTIPVQSQGNSVVLVSDISNVTLGKTERLSDSKLSIDGSKPLPSVSINVFKQGGGNIIDIVDTVNLTVAKFQEDSLLDDIAFEVVLDTAQFVRDDLGRLTTNGLATVLIVMVLLYITLGFREAILAGIAIPFSFLITFIFLQIAGSTINFISLFSLILALGILIDSAIVIIEGVHRKVSEGLEPTAAAKKIIQDFHLPLMAGVLTTVFAFLPMLLMSGIMGEFMKHLPITITFVLLSSLLVALGFVTTLSITWLKNESSAAQDRRKKAFGSLRAWYRKQLRGVLESKAKKRVLALLVVIGFTGSLALPMSGILQVSMFPDGDQDFVFVDVRHPVGTPIEVTEATLSEVSDFLLDNETIQSFTATVGSGSPTESGGSTGPHLGYIFITLQEERDVTSLDMIDSYQRIFNKEINADISIGQFGEGPPAGAPVEIRILGPELNQLEGLARTIEAELKQVPGTRDVRTTIKDRTGQFTISLDRQKAQLYGVTTAQLAGVLRNAVSGTEATIVRKDGEETPVIVKYALDPSMISNGVTTQVNLESILSLTISTQVGDIPLSAFTTTELTGARQSVSHKDGERIMRVSSDISQGTSAVAIFNLMQERMRGIEVPDGYVVEMGGETEDIEQSYNDMFRAMYLAVLLIAGLLILQFNSFRQPLFIMATIPLAFIGVFPGLALVGQPLSFPGIIGLVALVGIVVNNAIILIDRINRFRRDDGLVKMEAVIKAAESRLEPILLTTITTVIGILPLTLSEPIWGPLGWTIIFGLSFSTVLTLLIVPILYNKFGEKEV